MSQDETPRLSIWIFLLSDLAFLGLAGWLTHTGPRPLDTLYVLAVLTCVACGAFCAFVPFLRMYEAKIRLLEAKGLASTVSTVRDLTSLTEQVTTARAVWESANQEVEKSIQSAQEVYNRMAEETKAFHQFMADSQNAEVRNLRVEVEKLRKADQTWLELCVHMLDHVYAISSAAEKSDNSAVAQQHVQFRGAMYDIVRRVGLVPFNADEGEAFDERKHQLRDPNQKPDPGMVVAESHATGYTFQGQLLRRALVGVKPGDGVTKDQAQPETETADSVEELEASPEKAEEQDLL